MDILPTLFDAAGIAIPQAIEGRSFLPTFTGIPQPSLREQLFFCRREGGLQYGCKTIEAVIEWPWKLLQNSPWQPLELYNLETDPLEETDLASKNKNVVNRLNAAMRLQLQQGGRVPWQSPNSNN